MDAFLIGSVHVALVPRHVPDHDLKRHPLAGVATMRAAS